MMRLEDIWAAVLLAVVLAAIALMVIGATVARAHEWYPRDCCSGQDCAPLDGSRVRTTATGYVVDGRHMVPFAQARRSMDGRFHGCFPAPMVLRCLFAPPPGS